MELKKLIGAVAILSIILLAIPSASAQENQENYVTQARLENFVTSRQLENFATSQQLERVENSVSDLKQSIEELSARMENLGMQGEGKGGTITVIALTEDGMKPLNFGGMFGGSNPMMMWMMTQQQGKGMFSIPTIEPTTPVMLMGEHGLVRDATIDAYATSENGFVPINLQANGGMTVIPPVGKFISGTISAPNYNDTTFYVKIGKAKGKKKPKAGKVEIKSTPATLRPGEAAVVKAVRNGKIVGDATLSIFGREHPNPAQITVPKNQPSLYVEVLKDGKTVASEPLSIKKATAGGTTTGGGGGWSIPWSWIIIAALVALVGWKYRKRLPFIGSRRIT